MIDPKKNQSDQRSARVTIRDVAAHSKVAVSTVSKVLNKTGSVSQQTRERVMNSAKVLNFRPNSLARSLHTGLSGSIGLISNDSFGRFTMPIMQGLESELSEHGIGVFMSNATDDVERERMHIEQLIAKQVDGIIVTARRADHRPAVDLEALDLPVIYVFSQSDDPNALAFLPDDEGGAFKAVEHLTNGGCRNIVHITGRETFEAVNLRAAGYQRALLSAGQSILPVMHGSWSEQWGREAVAELLNNKTPFDAVFCGNDQIARGCADALREAALKVPEDIAIVGFDNWSVMAEACRPPLSSVDMNLNELGRLAANHMRRMIKGEKLSGIIRVDCDLVVRSSSSRIQKK